jgi:hypothetical protein
MSAEQPRLGGVGVFPSALARDIQHTDCQCHRRARRTHKFKMLSPMLKKTLVPVFPFLVHHARGRYIEGATGRKWGVQVGCGGWEIRHP